MRACVAGLVLMSMGCKPPPEAPAELDELSRYLYREWESPDPLVMSEGLNNLDVFLADYDLDAHVNDRSFELELLTREDLDASGIDWPTDRPLGELLFDYLQARSRRGRAVRRRAGKGARA